MHRSLRRLEAETIRDRMLVATNTLDPRLFGTPLKIKEDETGQVVVDDQSNASQPLYPGPPKSAGGHVADL